MFLNIPFIHYPSLNPRQQEYVNAHILASKLATYGFNCIKLCDDYNFADMIAINNSSSMPSAMPSTMPGSIPDLMPVVMPGSIPGSILGSILKIQLKGRFVIDDKYVGKQIYIAYRMQGKVNRRINPCLIHSGISSPSHTSAPNCICDWYVYDHDHMMKFIRSHPILSNIFSTNAWMKHKAYSWPTTPLAIINEMNLNNFKL